jgi:hypothetical protein
MLPARGTLCAARGTIDTRVVIRDTTAAGSKGPGAEEPASLTVARLGEAVRNAGGQLTDVEVDPETGVVASLQVTAPAAGLDSVAAALALLTGAPVRLPFIPMRVLHPAATIRVRLDVKEAR